MTPDESKVRLCLKQADKWAEEVKLAKSEKQAEYARKMQKHYSTRSGIY